MQVVYLDSFFVLNTLTDYFLLLLTARLAGIGLRRKRYVVAAVAGGGYAVLSFFPEFCFLTAPPVKIVAGAIMCLTAFGKETHLFRLTLMFFAVSCGFAGGTLALDLLLGGGTVLQGILYTDINTKVLAISFAVGYLLLHFVFRAAAKHGINGELLPVKLIHRNRVVEFTALLDSGNTLREPTGGLPVLVAAPQPIKDILPDKLQKAFTENRLKNPAELIEPFLKEDRSLQPRLLPYRTVGNAAGLLLTICPEKAEINGVIYPNLRVALSPTDLGNGYAALWGGNAGKERRR